MCKPNFLPQFKEQCDLVPNKVIAQLFVYPNAHGQTLRQECKIKKKYLCAKVQNKNMSIAINAY